MAMTEQELLKRKIVLKKQALKLFGNEIEDLEGRLALLKIQQHTEGRMKESFDPILSRKLDCINYLMEN